MSGVKSGTNKIWAKLGANKNGAATLRPLIYLKISDGYFRAPRDGLTLLTSRKNIHYRNP